MSRRLLEELVPEFLYHYMEQSHVVRWLEQHAVGTTMLNLSTRIVSDLPVRYPGSEVQRRIADILSAYDDLIENNRRRMALLEEAARQLYREWFVRLRFPGHEHTRITNGVPQGWERRVLADACESLEDGDWIESKDQGGEDFRLLQISNVGVNEFVETGNFRYITEQTFKRLNCRETLPGQILISRMPKPIGRAWLVTEMPWRMVTAVDVAIVAPKNDLAGEERACIAAALAPATTIAATVPGSCRATQSAACQPVSAEREAPFRRPRPAAAAPDERGNRGVDGPSRRLG